MKKVTDFSDQRTKNTNDVDLQRSSGFRDERMVAKEFGKEAENGRQMGGRWGELYKTQIHYTLRCVCCLNERYPGKKKIKAWNS